jgi:hypothetical protein
MIFITHGVLRHWDPDRISHGLLAPELQFAQYLQSRRTKFVPLMKAIAGRGDALTVDDATHAALRAVLIARLHGHAVSWFVNGSNVESRLTYFPFQLSFMLDYSKKQECSFDGLNWSLKRLEDRRALRLYAKKLYMSMSCQKELVQMTEAFACSLDVDPQIIDQPLSTVSRSELVMAVSAGVELCNHGWEHQNPLNISKEKLTAGVLQNEGYISTFQRATSRTFAPAFGKQVLLPSGIIDYMLLADRTFSPDSGDEVLINRAELKLAANLCSTGKGQATHIQVVRCESRSEVKYEHAK